MSEFLAEARIIVRPDTTKFRADLEAQLRAIRPTPIAVPIVASAAGLAAASAAASGLAAAQTAASETGLGLASTEQVLNSTLGRQAVILEGATVATTELAGAQAGLARASKNSTAAMLGAASASGRLDAGLLGLRTAIGSSAVIGLGALSLAAIAAGAAIRASIVNFASFQQEMATFRVVAGATADQMRSVSDEAKALGDDVRLPAVAATDAAIAMTELAKAGLSVEDAMAGARGVLELATAAQISNAEAAQIAANALNAFGLAGDQASRVADNLANAANAAQGSISDFGFAFQQASAVARQVGLSLEDTTALLSLFARNGLQGSDAGTSLRVALIRLVAPTKDAADEIRRLGLNIRDAQGNVRPDVFAQFGEATRDLAPSARDASAALIFGQDAIRAVSIGAREGVEGLRLMQFQIDQQGTASEVAAARTEGLAGAFGGLQSSAETLSVSVGAFANLTLPALLKGLSSVIQGINRTIGAFQGLGRETEKHIGPRSGFGQFIESLTKDTANLVDRSGIGDLRDAFRGTIDGISDSSLTAVQRLRSLNKQLQLLQDARIAAERGQPGSKLADELTVQIKNLRDEIKTLENEGRGLTSSVTNPLKEALEAAERARNLRISIKADTTDLDQLIRKLREAVPREPIENLIDFVAEITELAKSSIKGASAVDVLTQSLRDLGTQSAQAQAELLKLQTEGGTPGQQIGVLQSDIEIQRKIIEDAKARGGVGTATAIKQAREQILRDQAQIESLQNQITADAKAAAESAERAARDAQEQRDRQFQALADMFGRRQQGIEDALSRAGIAGNLDRQIRLNKALIAALQKERRVLLERLKTIKVSADDRRRILEAIRAAIEAAQQDAIRFQREQEQNRRETLLTRLDLRIRLAEVRENVRGQIAAHEAKLRQLRADLARLRKLHKGNTNEALQLKIDIAEEEKALKELAGQTKERNNSFAQATFEFLQAQQGFAANLFGNLIPSSATGGLVGNASPSTTRPVGADLSKGLMQSAAIERARTEGGFSAGQGNATNKLLHDILQQLKKLNRSDEAPEANRQWKRGSADMDGAGTPSLDWIPS